MDLGFLGAFSDVVTDLHLGGDVVRDARHIGVLALELELPEKMTMTRGVVVIFRCLELGVDLDAEDFAFELELVLPPLAERSPRDGQGEIVEPDGDVLVT